MKRAKAILTINILLFIVNIIFFLHTQFYVHVPVRTLMCAGFILWIMILFTTFIIVEWPHF